MYAVIKQPVIVPASTQPANAQVFMVTNNHLPEDSALFQNVLNHENTDFLFMNLQCNLVGAGTQVPIKYKASDGQVKQLPTGDQILGENGQPLPFQATTQSFLDCGTKRFPDVVPYVLMVALMVGLTFFQTFQMQRASPQGAQSSQQQTITRIMPLMFAFFGLTFPAGLVLYWTVSNALQIGQQTYLLKKGHIGPEALARQIELQKAKAQNPKRGVMSWMTDRATAAQRQRDEIQKKRGPKDKGASGQRTRGAGGTSSKKAPRPKKPSGNGSAGSAKEPPPPTQRRKGSAPGNQLRRNPQPDPPEDDG
jgi:hypothetical protein